LATSPIHSGEKETGRLEAFSDGVFAIGMTLLALDLKVPTLPLDSGRWALASALEHEWPAYLAFVTSFFTVLIMWVNHHAMFKVMHRVNARVLFANGFLLMLTTVVPFTTALVAEYLQSAQAPVACAVYTGTFVLISLSYNWLWHTMIVDRSLMRSGVSEDAIGKLTRNYMLGVPAYLVATAMAFVDVRVSVGICSALWIFWAFTAKDA
jgi:uncharacterized membrane protein